MNISVKVKLLNSNTAVPHYAHRGDSGFDLRAREDVFVRPGDTAIIPTGIAFQIPEGYEIQVRPRSGITAKTHLRVQLGTIDSGYRGEVCVIVDNIAPVIGEREFGIVENLHGQTETVNFPVAVNEYRIQTGDRIAQAVLMPVYRPTFTVVVEFEDDTDRGSNGFGSTGTA